LKRLFNCRKDRRGPRGRRTGGQTLSSAGSTGEKGATQNQEVAKVSRASQILLLPLREERGGAWGKGGNSDGEGKSWRGTS